MSEASAGAAVETTLQLGDAYQVLSASKRGQYVALLDGRRGWIDVHIAPVAPHAREAKRGRTVRHRKARTATNRSRPRYAPRRHRSSTSTHTARTRVTVRLHAQARIRARVLTLVPGNTPVRVLGRSGNWARVQVRGGRQGYVYGAYLANA